MLRPERVRILFAIKIVKLTLLALISYVFMLASASSQNVLVEAEMFSDPGGWDLDQQSMDVMGSPYLLAHGLGVPVKDAVTEVQIPVRGAYRVWVRTRDWVAHGGCRAPPGVSSFW